MPAFSPKGIQDSEQRMGQPVACLVCGRATTDPFRQKWLALGGEFIVYDGWDEARMKARQSVWYGFGGPVRWFCSFACLQIPNHADAPAY